MSRTPSLEPVSKPILNLFSYIIEILVPIKNGWDFTRIFTLGFPSLINRSRQNPNVFLISFLVSQG